LLYASRKKADAMGSENYYSGNPRDEKFLKHAREQVRDIDLQEFTQGLRGKEYKRLVEAHLRELDQDTLKMAILVATHAFNKGEQEVVSVIIDQYNQLGYDREFWSGDCADVFSDMSKTFEIMLTRNKSTTEPKMKFNLFNLITDNFALMASEQITLQEFMGISRHLRESDIEIEASLKKAAVQEIISRHKMPGNFLTDKTIHYMRRMLTPSLLPPLAGGIGAGMFSLSVWTWLGLFYSIILSVLHIMLKSESFLDYTETLQRANSNIKTSTYLLYFLLSTLANTAIFTACTFLMLLGRHIIWGLPIKFF